MNTKQNPKLCATNRTEIQQPQPLPSGQERRIHAKHETGELFMPPSWRKKAFGQVGPGNLGVHNEAHCRNANVNGRCTCYVVRGVTVYPECSRFNSVSGSPFCTYLYGDWVCWKKRRQSTWEVVWEGCFSGFFVYV